MRNNLGMILAIGFGVVVMVAALLIAEAFDANAGATLLTIIVATVIGALGLVWTLDRQADHH